MQSWQSEVVGIRRSYLQIVFSFLVDYIYEGYKPMTIYLLAAKRLFQTLTCGLIRPEVVLFIRRVEGVDLRRW